MMTDSDHHDSGPSSPILASASFSDNPDHQDPKEAIIDNAEGDTEVNSDEMKMNANDTNDLSDLNAPANANVESVSALSEETHEKNEGKDVNEGQEKEDGKDGEYVKRENDKENSIENEHSISMQDNLSSVDALNEFTDAESTASNHLPGSATEEALPDRKLINDCLRIDLPTASILEKDNASDIEKLDVISKSYRKTSNNFLLESKFSDINRNFELKDAKMKELINSGSEHIKKTFNDIKNTVGGLNDSFGYEIDWEFWTKVVNNYEQVIKEDSDELNFVISSGIPKEFRGIIWQLIARSKNFQLEEFYLSLKSESSVHEKSMKRDLSRTSFFTNVEQVNKGEELFNVIKAYSLFDPDVGYTQGMIFITVPLIINMSESECFCLLVTLMKEYNLRSLFCPEMKGLHLLLYEFDRILEDKRPILFNLLAKQGIKSSMYASQWFLTFFAYKFPLDIVLRIYDIIVTQGIESILKFAVNLMIKNENKLLTLSFDGLLSFLKDNLFNFYVNEEYVVAPGQSEETKSRRFSLLGGKKPPSSPKNYYNLDALVKDSMKINLDPLSLGKYEAEFENIYSNEKSKIKEIEKLQIENGKLRHEIKGLETDYSHLSRDHIDVVQKMVDIKVALPEIISENEELAKSIDKLNLDIKELESKMESTANNGATLPSSIEDDIQKLLVINAEETEKSVNYEEEIIKLQAEDADLEVELQKHKTSKNWFSRWK